MKRPLMTFVGVFVLGEVLGLCQFAEGVWEIWCVFAAIFLTFFLYHYFGKGNNKLWLLLPVFLLAGILRGKHTYLPPMQDVFGSNYVMLKGEVYWQEEKNDSYLIYLKNIAYISENINSFDSRIIIYLKERPDLKIGNILLVEGRWESFPKARNPGQFDSAFYYKTLKITGRLFVDEWEIISTRKHFCRQYLYSIRQKLSEVLRQIGEEQEASLFAALLLGDKGQLDMQLKELYQRNGIAHLLAISGLHISILGMGIYKLLRNLGRSYGFCGIISTGLMVSYGFMTGSSASVVRALIMFCLHLLADILGRTYDVNTAVSVAAALIFMDHPLLLLSSGVQLSFGAVLGISLLSPILIDIVKTENKIWQSLLVSISLQLTTLPVCIYHYFEYPRYTLMINFIVIPLITFVIYSGTFGILFGLFSIAMGSFSIGMGHYILRFYTLVCHLFENLPFAADIVGRPKLWQIAAYYGIAISLLIIACRLSEREKKHPCGDTKMAAWPIKKKKNPVLVIAFLLVFVYIGLVRILAPIESKMLEITFLDVGQGDGIFIKVPNGGAYLIDGGSLDVKEMGKYRLEPFLKYKGISSIDYAIITHGDKDHISGLSELMENQSSSRIEIKNIVVSKFIPESEEGSSLLLKASELGIPVLFMEDGRRIQDGKMVLSCIYPAEDCRPPSANDGSIVLDLQYEGFRGLFTGDLEACGERWILTNVELETYHLLKVGHHGSKSSSSQSFIEAVHPEVAVISCGIDNSFGHPHREVVERLEAVNSQIFQTSVSGAVVIEIHNGLWRVQEFLEKSQEKNS